MGAIGKAMKGQGVEGAFITLAGTAIMLVLVAIALVCLLLANLKYCIILVVAVVIGMVANQLVKSTPWAIQLLVWLASWALNIGAVVWSFHDIRTSLGPVLSNEAVMKSKTQLRKKAVGDLEKLWIDVYVEEGEKVEVLGATKNGITLKIKTAEGKQGFIFTSSIVGFITPAKVGSIRQVSDGFILKKDPYILEPGRYRQEADPQGDFLWYGKKADPSKTKSPIIVTKNETPVIYNGVPYNYTATVRRPEDPKLWKFVGDYVVTSSATFVNPETGQVWRAAFQ